MNLDLTLCEVIPHPVDRVWRALTDTAALARWLMDNDFAARVGHRFTLRGAPDTQWRGVVECEVLELQPPRRMVWSWRSEAQGRGTRVTFELEPTDQATRLTIRHIGEMDPALGRRTEKSWPRKIRALRHELA